MVIFGTPKLDELGCVMSSRNGDAKLLNLQLHALCTKLPGEFTDTNIAYFDIFTVKHNVVANFSRNCT